MSLSRARIIMLLARPTARAIGWGPLLGAGALAVVYVYLQSPDRYIDHRILVLRLGALLIALGLAFVLDDSSEETIASVTTPRLVRCLVRVALALPIAAALWAIVLTAAGEIPPSQGGPIPRGDLTFEAATVCAIALAASSLARRAHDGVGGVVAAPIVLAFVTVALLAPTDPRLLPSVGDLDWSDAHVLWRYILLGAALAFLYANRDPARTGLIRRLKGLRPNSRKPAPSAVR
jgi:fluoroquinolone transport system permease protein